VRGAKSVHVRVVILVTVLSQGQAGGLIAVRRGVRCPVKVKRSMRNSTI